MSFYIFINSDIDVNSKSKYFKILILCMDINYKKTNKQTYRFISQTLVQNALHTYVLDMMFIS